MPAFLHDPMIVWTARAFLALLFAVAAVGKLTAREEFYGVVRNFRLLPDGLSRLVAAVLPVVELLVAVALLVDPVAQAAALAAAALLAVFGVAIAINVIRGRTWIDCGCFRNGMKQRISWLMVLRNLVLTLLALGTAVMIPQAPEAGVLHIGTGLLASAVLMLLYFSASIIDGLFSRQHSTHMVKGR